MVSERPEKRPGPVDVKSPADDGQARRVESAGRAKQPSHMTKRDSAPQVRLTHTEHSCLLPLSLTPPSLCLFSHAAPTCFT